jgi:hypothetical protein
MDDNETEESTNGDVEKITDSTERLEELHSAVLATKRKQKKRKRQDSKIAATNSRKSKKRA